MAASVDDLRVGRPCPCGCASLDFEDEMVGAHPIADAVAIYADGKEADVTLFGKDGRIVGLEFSGQASDRLPTVADLRTWEQAGIEDLNK